MPHNHAAPRTRATAVRTLNRRRERTSNQGLGVQRPASSIGTKYERLRPPLGFLKNGTATSQQIITDEIPHKMGHPKSQQTDTAALSPREATSHMPHNHAARHTRATAVRALNRRRERTCNQGLGVQRPASSIGTKYERLRAPIRFLKNWDSNKPTNHHRRDSS
jgi:hypothetical protein